MSWRPTILEILSVYLIIYSPLFMKNLATITSRNKTVQDTIQIWWHVATRTCLHDSFMSKSVHKTINFVIIAIFCQRLLRKVALTFGTVCLLACERCFFLYYYYFFYQFIEKLCICRASICLTKVRATFTIALTFLYFKLYI